MYKIKTFQPILIITRANNKQTNYATFYIKNKKCSPHTVQTRIHY